MASAMNGTSSNRLPSGAIMYLIRHIFLPPKLPHEDDFDSEYETILLDTTVDVLSKCKGCVTYGQNGIIDSVIAMITNLRTVRDSFGTVGAVSEGKLGNALRDLCKEGKHMSHQSCDLFHSL
jgi:hypothetical protein